MIILAELHNLVPGDSRKSIEQHEGNLLSVVTPLPKGVTIPEVVEKCAQESGYWQQTSQGWKRKSLTQPVDSSKRRGVGFACGFKNVGFSFGAPEESWATLEMYGNVEDERQILRQAGAEVRQGA